jgi:thiol-disulfide isomerase/thioredoxin
MKKLLNIFCLLSLSMVLQAQHIELIQAPDIIEQVKKERGVVVINFWSTWCKPCIDEIPHFIKVYDSLKEKGVQLWLVSQDTRDLYHSGKLKNYIAKKEGWDKARLFWMNETNADYYCPIIDADWSGVIPATLILNREKGYRLFYEEPMSAEMLMKEIAKALGE